MFGKGNKNTSTEEMVADPSEWFIVNSLAEFCLMHTAEIKYMCMFGYTFLHGCKVFSSVPQDASFSYKFISMVFACTGGGILVPIFLNKVPVPLAMDAYPIAIACSFFLHYFFPILREVLQKSPIVDASFTFLYEVTRASVVVKFTGIAREVIPASDFSFPVFGPIFCGAISGCGGAFLPLNKGLDPIKSKGLASPMFTALVGATFYHLFLSLYGEENVMQANRKAHFATVLYFVLNTYNNKWGFNAPRPKDVPVEKKKKL